jgi:uridine kinase
MLGDTLLIKDMHKAAAEAIAKWALSEMAKMPKSYKFILGISGESGSGKSELSHSIAQRLKKEHIRVKFIHTGNYYKVPPLLMTEWRKTKGIESVGMSEYDWNLLSRNIEDFKEERESMMPCIDVVPEQVDKLITDFKKIDFLIISGLYAIKADGADLRVFVDMNYKEIHATKNINPKDFADEFQLKVLEKEHQNVQSLKPLADLIINKNYQVVLAKTGESIM